MTRQELNDRLRSLHTHLHRQTNSVRWVGNLIALHAKEKAISLEGTDLLATAHKHCGAITRDLARLKEEIIELSKQIELAPESEPAEKQTYDLILRGNASDVARQLESLKARGVIS